MKGFDWPALMRMGMHGLGLKPWEFWALTPAELMILTGREVLEMPFDRARLAELAAAFPDVKRETQNG